MLPLHQGELAVRLAVGVPGQRAKQRRPGTRVQHLDDRRVVDLAGLLRDLLQELAAGERLGGAGVDLLRGAAVLLDVGGGERGAAGRGGPGEPVGGGHDARRVTDADLLRELLRGVGSVGQVHELRVDLQLHQRLDLGVGVLVLRAADQHVRAGGRDAGHHRRQVLRLGRVHLLEHGPDAGGLELGPDALRDRRRERVVQFGVRRGLGPLGGRQRQHPVGEHVTGQDRRRRLHEEQVRKLLREHRRPAAGRLKERVAVALGDLRRRHREQAGERSEHQVGMRLVDQVLVVGDHL